MTARRTKRRAGGTPIQRQTRKQPPDRKRAAWQRENRRLMQLAACSGIFVLLVAVKLLLPGKMARINHRLSALLNRNMDVQAVFSALGRAASGEGEHLAEEVYQAVFQPEQAVPASAAERSAAGEAAPQEETQREATPQEETQQDAAAEETAAVSEMAYVLYSEKNLPEHVKLEQELLGFDYCTPVIGTETSSFGYREHPIEGEERFHYGLDIGAAEGTAITAFADGTVTAVGESTSYGKYLTIQHAGDYTTLYAHCSRITAVSGEEVRKGETIAEVGETGMATGSHLHFELHKGDTYLNPVYYVSFA